MGEKKFGTMITNEGAALIADCILRGEVLPITTAAAGDGGGAYYEPSADQTALRNECWRGEIAGFALSEYAANMLDVKVIIDDEAGGFTIREMGLFTADGVMVAVCNTPDTEKITVTGGMPGRLTMVMHIIVADSNAVEIVVNPELDVVTPNQLDSKIALHDSDANAHADIFSSLRDDIQAANAIATEAQTAAQTAQSAVQSVSSASTPTAFSVEAAWTALASPVVGRGYSAEIAAEGVTAGDFPDVYFDAASVEAASTASILADTADGAIVLYAKSIPTTALSGAYFIRKGVIG